MYFCKNGQKYKLNFWKGCRGNSQCKDNKCQCPEGQEAKKKDSVTGEEYCQPERKKPSGKPTKVSCDKRRNFQQVGLRCVRVSPKKDSFENAESNCRNGGARLLNLKNLISDPNDLLQGMKGNGGLKKYCNGEYWLGGVEALNDMDLFLGETVGGLLDAVNSEVALTATKRLERLQLGVLLGEKYADVSVACREILAGQRSNANLNACPEFKDKCLVFTPNGPKKIGFRSCKDRLQYLCEDSPDADADEDWEYTDFINIGKPDAQGDREDRTRAVKDMAKKGKCLCKRPLGIRARIAGTETMLSSEDPQGFKFSLNPAKGFRCLNKDQEGGKKCPDVEVAYACPIEKNSCEQNNNKAKCEAANRDCVNRCGGGHYCRRRKRSPTRDVSKGRCCVGANEDLCVDTGVCSASGDPHYNTFDGIQIDYMGPCTYTLSENLQASEGCPVFMVEAENRPKPGSTATWLKTIILKYRGHKVELLQGKAVRVDGSELNLPYDADDGSFSMKALGTGTLDFMQLKTDFCLTIKWDGDRKVRIEAPDTCKARVRGICGNWNGNSGDDWTKKTGTLVDMSKSQREKSLELGDSWRVPNSASTLESCVAKVLRDCSAEEEQKFGAGNACGILTSASGPFAPMLANAEVKKYLEESQHNCMVDMCNSEEPELCSAISKVADEMHTSFDLSIDEAWRDMVPGCPARCGANMTYDQQATECQPTCDSDPDDDDNPPSACPNPDTRPACRCNDGYVLSGDKCVTRDQCGCLTPEGYLLPGQEIVDKNCETRYKCVRGDDGVATTVSEANGSCDEHATCTERKCVCNDGYDGDGKTCRAKPVTCPRGWQKQGSMCYRVKTRKMTWMQAQKECGCGSGGMAQLCAAHTPEQLTFLKEYYTQKRIKNGLWGAGNTVAETKSYDVIMQTTPSRLLAGPDEAGCHYLIRGANGNLSPQVDKCEAKRGYCCMIDPNANRDIEKVWTPKVVPWKTPNGGRAFTPNQAVRRNLLMCPDPFDLECMTADGRAWNQTGQTAMCNPRRGFICRGAECSDYRVSGLCLKDVNECEVLGSNACSGGQECINCIGGFDCRCPGKSKFNKRNQCESPEPGCGQCIASGDPHYTTWFGKRFDWQGRCKYVLTETCPLKMSAELPFPCFRIVVKNTPCGKTEKKVTCTFYVEVHIFRKCADMSLLNSERTLVRLDRDGTYTYAGQSKRKAPLSTAEFAVQYNPSTKMVELATPWGLKVVYKGSKVYVDVPKETMGHLCGLCGDCATPEGFELRDGQVLPIVMKGKKIDPEFIANVALNYEEPDPSEESCEAPNPEEEPECTDAQNAIIADDKHCGFFKDARFDGCRERADMEFLACEEDLCAVIDTPDFEETTCRRIAEMVEGCRLDIGQDSPQIVWRNVNFCPKDCAANETFTDNAALEEMCFETENNDDSSVQPVEGCICQSGFKRDPLSQQCVEPDACGCQVSYQMTPPSTEQISFYAQKGEVVSKNTDCEQARCEGGTLVDLPLKKLSPNGVCDVTKKPPEARCRAGFEGDGFTCTPTQECEDGWVDVNKKCTFFSSEPLPWSLAAAKCAQMDGVLATCETTSQCEAFEEALKDKSNAYWGRGVVQITAADRYTSLLQAKGLGADLKGANNYYIPAIPTDLSPLLDGEFPTGTRLCYSARYNVDSLMFQLVPCTRPLNFACTKRDPSEPKEFTEFCHADNDARGKQLETTAAMNEADCKICKEPMEVECRAVDAANRDKKQTDRCGGMGETVYACLRQDQDGEAPCFKKDVRGKCYPGLDECQTGLHECGQNATCVDEFYGYRCDCRGTNINVNGECVETERCAVALNPVMGLTLTTVSGSPLNYETRCKFTMASSCGSQGVEDSDRPNFRLDIQSVMNPSNAADFTNIVATITLNLKGEEAVVVIDRTNANFGKITVDGQRYSLPYNGLSESMGVRIRDIPNKGVVLWRPNDQDLKIDVCFRAGCSERVSVRMAGEYKDGCGVCGVDEALAGTDVTDILEAEITDDSEVSCSPAPTLPPVSIPPTDLPPPEDEPALGPSTTAPQASAECSQRFGQECMIVANPQMPFAVCTDVASLQTQCVALRCDGDDLCTALNKLLRHVTCSISSMTPAQQDFMMDETSCEVDVADDCERDYGGDNQCGILLLPSGPFSTCGLDNEAYMTCLTRSCTQPKAEMCKYLKEVASGCASMTDDQKRNFMQQTDCVDDCGPGMRFSFSIRNYAPSCEDPYELDPTGESGTMGCVCDVGYLMSGGQCILRSDCGCRVGDEYKERGAEWMSDDCTKRYRCDGNDNLSTFDEACGDNAECDGAGRCECAEGTMGDCCSFVEDRGNMTCYLACDGTTTICNCKMGFSSACGTCVDHNECLTGKHSCENNEVCVNLPGDYECKCAPGYERDQYTEKCKDVNECANAEETGVGLCPKGSQCVNRDPFYECICCNGYIQGPNGCVQDPSATEAALEGPCCRCLGTKCLLVGSFCYTETDGSKTDYASYREMYQQRCAQNKPLKVESYSEGTCESPAPTMAPGLNPPPPVEGPAPNPPQGGGPCDKSICTDSEQQVPQGGAVCLDSTKTTYPTVCELKMATCKKNNNTPPPSLPAYTNGPCPTPPPAPPATPDPSSPLTFTPWGEWSECLYSDPSVRCGAIGTHFRERQKSGGSGTPTEDQIRQRASCSLPACPSEPVKVTPGPCLDVSQCPQNPRYVCATIGVDGRPATYTTPCHFEIAACQSGAEGSRIIHDGRCNPGEEKPQILPCEGSVIPEVVKTFYRKDPSTGETCVGEDMLVKECKYSFCDSDDVRVCCQATAFVDVEFRVECSVNGTVTSTRMDRYESATKCECVNKDEAEGTS